MQTVLYGWVQTPLPFRGDVTSIFASFSAGGSECNTCTAGIPALKLGQLTFTKVPRSLQTGWFPPHHWHSKAWWRHKAAHYPWIRANADPVSASPQKPELNCASAHLGFGALLVSETPVRVHGKNMSEWSARRTLQKKHQMGKWSGLQINNQYFEHPPAPPEMAMNTGGLIRVLGWC